MTINDAGSPFVAEADQAASVRDFPAAQRLLEQAIIAAPQNLDAWLKLASVRRAAADPLGALDAVMRALALSPLHFLALLLRGSLMEQLGDPEAGEVYGYALAQRPTETLPPAVERAVTHAERCYRRHIDDRDTALAKAMLASEKRATPEEARRMARFRGNVLRKTKPFHSEPTHYHFPGLTEREFHDRAAFPWLECLEASTDAIAEDLERVMMAERSELVPYVQYANHIPMNQWKALNNSRNWTAIHLLRRGCSIEANARHCPATMAALSSIPQPFVVGRGPNAMFSLLAPGTAIPPHTGVANTRLVCHLPLVVPDGCWFRVGAETRMWERGKAFVFDDTIEHEAANPSDRLRVVLIADVWHPDLSKTERAGVVALMEAESGPIPEDF